jgi:hypothetical protein
VSAQHDAWINEASRALEAGNAEAAVAPLTRYLTDTQQRPATANFSLLGKAWLMLSTAHFRRGKEEEGKTALDELARLRPDIVLDESYPPLFLRLHQKALERIKSKADSMLRITGDDDGTLSLNGRLLRAGAVTEVPAGTHYVALLLGSKQLVRKIEIKAGETKSATFGGNERSSAIVSYFSLLASETKPEPRVIAAETPPVNDNEPRRRALGTAEPPTPRIVVPEEPSKDRTLIAAPVSASRSDAPTSKAAAVPVYKQWWLWTILGVAVAGGAVATALVLTAKVGDVSVNAQW